MQTVDIETKYRAGCFLASCFHAENATLHTRGLFAMVDPTVVESKYWPQNADPKHYARYRQSELPVQIRLIDHWIHMITDHYDYPCDEQCVLPQSRREKALCRAYRRAIHADARLQKLFNQQFRATAALDEAINKFLENLGQYETEMALSASLLLRCSLAGPEADGVGTE